MQYHYQAIWAIWAIRCRGLPVGLGWCRCTVRGRAVRRPEKVLGESAFLLGLALDPE